MKNILLVSILYLISVSVFPQKVSVQILKSEQVALTEWRILDEQYTTVFTAGNNSGNDSLAFSLEADRKYFLQVTVSEVYKQDTSLYILKLNLEPILIINSELAPGDHLFPFFTGIRTKDLKITGGTDAAISGFPWQVFFRADNFQCGGSIISNKWVVTAAHCTEYDDGSAIPASVMSVKVGATNPYNLREGKTYSVSQVIVHEGYNNENLENDIALLRIKDSINFPNASPIKLLSAKDAAEGAANPGVMAWVTGWGLTIVSPKVFPDILQKVELPIVSNATAAIVWGTIPSTNIMAGYRSGNKDACNGDSGGPLIVPVLGEYKLAGIVSWGSSNCNSYGGYTKISLFENWIRTKTGIPILYTPPKPFGDTLVCQGVLSSQYSVINQPSVTAYEWKLYPSSAGVISGNGRNASILWNISRTGSVAVMVRVTTGNIVSDWSKTDVNIVLNTRLLSQSGDTSLCALQPYSLNVQAEGYKLIYKWYQNSDLVQTSTLNQLGYSSLVASNSGNYRCNISGSCGTVFSNSINLTVHPLTNITYLSPDVEVPFGNNVTVEVIAEGHDLKYQWEKDGIVLANRNNPILDLQQVNAKNIGLYKTTVKGTCGTKVSNTVYVYVKKDNTTVETEVFVWPTVTTSAVNVALSTDDAYNIQIFSIMGRLIKEQTNCRYQTLVDISTFAGGVYILNVSNNNFRKSVKLVKQ
jgi:hypothetical protein